MQDGILRICWWGTFSEMHGLDNILESNEAIKEKVPFICNLFGVTTLFYIYAEKFSQKNLIHVFS